MAGTKKAIQTEFKKTDLIQTQVAESKHIDS
jgi:hypothetical protein